MKIFWAATAMAPFFLSGGALYAQDADSAFSIEGYVGAVTDFRDRGLSLSDGDVAVMASVGAFHESGFYFGLDAAKIDTANIGPGNGGNFRTEFFAGYSLDRGDYVYDLSVEFDSIYGDTTQYYPEFKASISRDFGIAFTRVGAAYAPGGRWNNPQNQSFYTYADLELPVPTLPALTVVSHVGRDFRSDVGNIWDWSVGLSLFVGDVELSLSYDDASLDQRAGNGEVIFGARFYF